MAKRKVTSAGQPAAEPNRRSLRLQKPEDGATSPAAELSKEVKIDMVSVLALDIHRPSPI
jgi:hypothetical protein